MLIKKKKGTKSSLKQRCIAGQGPHVSLGKSSSQHTHHEAFQSPVVRVQKEARHWAHLGSPVPAIRTVNKHASPFLQNCLKNTRWQRVTKKGYKQEKSPIRNRFGHRLTERNRKKTKTCSFFTSNLVKVVPRTGLMLVAKFSFPSPYIQRRQLKSPNIQKNMHPMQTCHDIFCDPPATLSPLSGFYIKPYWTAGVANAPYLFQKGKRYKNF
jgi:hypothetical protein